MSLIKAVTPILSELTLANFKNAISNYDMNRARIIIDDAKYSLCPNSPDYLILDGVENDIINEIEENYDEKYG